MPPHRSGRDFLVLHTLRCIGFTTAERIATVSGLEPIEVAAGLRALEARGLVFGRQGVFEGWGLTDPGRLRDREWAATELAAAGAREGVTMGYEDFLALNPRLLKVCQDWQMHRADGVHLLNDHRDPDYDVAVVDRLAAIDDAIQPTLDSLSGLLARFVRYASRLATALERVEAGERAYFTDGLDSFHTVWFQLHEDLLVTLGLERQTEDGDPATR